MNDAGPRTFLITTIYNDESSYADLRASFAAAGFDADRCEYVALDNRECNRWEPYSAFAAVAAGSEAPYLIFCHQDVRPDLGHGFDRLLAVLTELDTRDPQWAVAGNAGVDTAHRPVVCVRDPTSAPWWSGPWPWPVVCLDENFFVVRGRENARWSAGLGGFHHYGADVCLHAIARGRGVYVVDFNLTHLGAGRIAPHYEEQFLALTRVWTRCASLCFGRSIMGKPFVLTRHRLLRWLFDRPAMRRRLQRPRWRKWLRQVLPPISPQTLRRQPEIISGAVCRKKAHEP